MYDTRPDSTTPKAKRTYSVVVEGVGQVFASDSLYNAIKEMKSRGSNANLVHNRKFVAFINHEGKATATNYATDLIRVCL